MATVFPLTADRIAELNKGFTDGYGQLWKDVGVFAARVHEESDDMAWHHLLMAVGNFKRQTPIFTGLLPRDVFVTRKPEVTAFDEISQPFVVGCEDHSSWELVDRIPGLGVPTTTTVLAALWPDRHAILDRKVRRMALALAGSQGDWSFVGPDETKSPDMTWDLYGWYRECVVATAAEAGLAVHAVERALFFLDDEMPRDESRTWSKLAEIVVGS